MTCLNRSKVSSSAAGVVIQVGTVQLKCTVSTVHFWIKLWPENHVFKKKVKKILDVSEGNFERMSLFVPLFFTVPKKFEKKGAVFHLGYEGWHVLGTKRGHVGYEECRWFL